MSPAHAFSVLVRKAAAARRRARARSILASIPRSDPALMFGGVSPYALAHRHGPAWPSAGAPRDLFGRVFPESSRYAVAEADLILAGQVRLFGRLEDVSVGLNASRGAGAATPAADHAGGPVAATPATDHAGGPGIFDWDFHPRDDRRELFGADPKFPWELGRHAFLPRLGVAWSITRDPRYADGAAALVLDWVTHQSRPAGLQWESALEVGIRLIAWCQAFHFFRGAPAFKGAVIEELLRHVAIMSTWLEANLSTDRVVAGNHLLGEVAGLIVADLYFPEMGERGRLARNIRLFTAEVEKQVAPDGVSLEQSSTYGRFAGDFIVAVLGSAWATGTGVPAELSRRAAALAGWLSALTRHDGTLPLIGDNDSGKGVDWGEPNASHDARPVILALSALLDEAAPLSNFKGPQIPSGAEVVFWWMGEEGLKRLGGLIRSAGAGSAVHHFPAGGHAVVKTGPDFLHVRCGPFGHGLPRPSAHSHADWMSPVLTLFGYEILVDPGNFGYTTVGAWRDLFRSDATHSLFRVDDRPLAIPADTFRWRDIPPKGRLEVAESSGEVRLEGGWAPVGESGYKAVVCVRAVVYNKMQRLISIEDEWSGAVSRGIVWRWRLPGESRLEIRPDGSGFDVALPAGARFSFELSPAATVSVEQGWVAPRYAERIPAPIAVVERSAPHEPDGRQITVIRFLSGSGEMPS